MMFLNHAKEIIAADELGIAVDSGVLAVARLVVNDTGPYRGPGWGMPGQLHTAELPRRAEPDSDAHPPRRGRPPSIAIAEAAGYAKGLVASGCKKDAAALDAATRYDIPESEGTIRDKLKGYPPP